ncbi:16S rRNA (uracil(1498)-N(3))-methyltransferase [Cocleimonas sp. KMM 6892]|uniref:16S rRNA (uracil(1498)-N(3))-methyltransferase n=1 Tax=unclassified Cocleimonas TaxID=2639732 RepID=UPI002DC04BA1|nr:MULTISPECIES: 16S rRNA (uracil(1498)-N(3))-methyltransferase [unclassified Cocleimonas]MEB8431600.1 16S rRNA (uracil(1498)-N(3))-methyltransferase [Cocleimonas sp. KMM 6892]MEC4713628.1 16S rRNA (uracil(1498)-N(3))-methyltransferase [Cocleimonas sp. KMM 6895]MEC4742959.1 16S rRNA (uracil(1498)-N(3))-methyltransferase [Cocleimonas sp. KMM 6896]
MRVSRFYQEGDIKVGEELALTQANHRHAVQVLRLKEGDDLILFNGQSGEYAAKVSATDKRNSQVIVEEYDPVNRESSLSITLILANIKPDKMDFAIQKAVELGVSTIQPMYTKRSVIKLKSNRLEKKMQHWQGVIIAACEQSGRTAIPAIKEPCDFEEIFSAYDGTTQISMLPGSENKIQQMKLDESHNGVSLIIGPEGGFSDEEEQLMQSKKVQSVNFGKRILRAETAAVAGITACQMAWGDL